MKPFSIVLPVVVIAASTPLHAQLFRAYLSLKGNDSNTCTLQSPCRLLPAALSAVADGGEIWILDSANFNVGTVNIAKSVSIQAVPGEVGSVVALGGASAMTIATAGVKVGLRNLVIGNNANSPGLDGIDITDGSMLSVEDCLFANLPGAGIKAVGTTANIHVKNTVFRNGAGYGVWAESGPNVEIVNSQFVENSGVIAYGHAPSTTTSIAFTGSTASGGNYGVVAQTDAAASASAFVTRGTIYHTGYGALVSQVSGAGTALVSVAESAVTDNAYGYIQSGTGSTVKSLANNYIGGNNLDVGALTPASFR